MFIASQMNCTPNFPLFSKLHSKIPPNSSPKIHFTISSNIQPKQEPSSSSITTKTTSNQLKVKFQTMETCKLGISSYPYFQYNATGGMGTGTGSKQPTSNDIQLSFDANTLYIPPLQTTTTRFLGLPLPPFLKIAILPQLFQGTLNKITGKVELQFKAEFCFSVGSIYKAPPLFVETLLTTEEAKGEVKIGRGERMDGEGKCRLVGIATVEPVNDVLMNSFLGLPTECIADLNASISIS